MKPNDQLICLALAYLSERQSKADTMWFNSKKIKGPIRGYINAFGGSVVQVGLLPTMIFYYDKRMAVADGIAYLYGCQFADPRNQALSVENLINNHLIKNSGANNRGKIRGDIMACAIALKLAMRTYAFDDCLIED